MKHFFALYRRVLYLFVHFVLKYLLSKLLSSYKCFGNFRDSVFLLNIGRFVEK